MTTRATIAFAACFAAGVATGLAFANKPRALEQAQAELTRCEDALALSYTLTQHAMRQTQRMVDLILPGDASTRDSVLVRIAEMEAQT